MAIFIISDFPDSLLGSSECIHSPRTVYKAIRFRRNSDASFCTLVQCLECLQLLPMDIEQKRRLKVDMRKLFMHQNTSERTTWHLTSHTSEYSETKKILCHQWTNEWHHERNALRRCWSFHNSISMHRTNTIQPVQGAVIVIVVHLNDSTIRQRLLRSFNII